MIVIVISDDRSRYTASAAVLITTRSGANEPDGQDDTIRGLVSLVVITSYREPIKFNSLFTKL